MAYIPDLVNIQKAIIENEPVEIVDLPIENDHRNPHPLKIVIFHSYIC